MQCKCTIPATLWKITAVNWTPVIANVINKVSQLVLKVIQSPGFCPVNSGDLRDGHFLQKSGQLYQSIKCKVGYWIHVVYGHRVVKLKTEKQRKAYFAMLKEGKADTPKGIEFVAPNNYIFRAVVEVFRSGAVQSIIQGEVRKNLGR